MLGEVQALARMDSPFIIKYYGSFMYDDRMFIVTEYAANGDLHNFLKRQTKPLEEEIIWKLLLQVHPTAAHCSKYCSAALPNPSSFNCRGRRRRCTLS